MPGLFGSLTLSAKALQAQQTALEVTGRNIGNVNNPEYARQRVILGERYSVPTSFGPEGTGVELLQVQQIRDALLDRQVVRQISDRSSLDAQEAALKDTELALGDRVDNATTPTSVTDTSFSTSGISGALDDFFNSFETLSTSPAEIPNRDAAIQSAQILADRFNLADERIAHLQTDSESQIKSDVERVNLILNDIARLNAEIRQAGAAETGGAADLIDKRQAKLEQLAALGKFELSSPTDAPNQVDVSLGGFLLVTYGVTPNGPNPLLYTSATPATSAGLYPQSSATGFTKGKLSINGVDVTSNLTGGSIQGRINAITGGMTTLRSQLKTMADQITTAVNAQYAQDDGTGNGTTVSFFSTTPTSGLMQVNTSLTSANLATGANANPLGTNTNAGDNSYVKGIAGLRKTIFSTAAGDKITGKLGDYIRTSIATLAQNIKSVGTRAEEAKVIDTAIRAQRDSVSGVSLDEETTNILRFQRAYQANAKVISVLDTMLDAVINSMVR